MLALRMIKAVRLFLLFSPKNGVHISVEKDYGVRQTMNHFAAKELDTSFGG